ncbi:hypothetical protein [Lysobacter sp. HA35]
MFRLFKTAALAALLLVAMPAFAQDATGTLVLDVKPFQSEVTLKPKIQSQLESGGVEWGLKDHQMVVTMVNKRFVDFDIAHMTRYGRSETLALPPGEYSLTGIGLEMHTAFSPEKVLAKGAFVNADVVKFTIEPGKTTTLTMLPIIGRDMTFLIEWYMPALMTSVTTDAAATPPVAINVRGDTSIAWPAYNGALKFKAAK